MATVVVSDDVEVFFSDHGRGPSVLMLHGWTCDGADWSWLAGDLAVDHRVVVPDLRGHGRSTRTVDGYGARTLVDDMVRLLGHLAIEHAVVVGHSMGAIVASVMAVEHPDMVSAFGVGRPQIRTTRCEGRVTDRSDEVGSAEDSTRHLRWVLCS
jgi:pimeloyl-ACP methyl ester carboxylesterase